MKPPKYTHRLATASATVDPKLERKAVCPVRSVQIQTDPGSAALGKPRRTADPKEYLHQDRLSDRLSQELVGAPWDVFTGPEVARAIDDSLSPLALNDWSYKRVNGAPPREPPHFWRGNKGYYRKDRLLAWARSRGRPLPAQAVWQLSAEYLSEMLCMRRPWTLRDTEEDILWMLDKGLISLRAHPRYAWVPFTSDPSANNANWGTTFDYPLGILGLEMMIAQ